MATLLGNNWHVISFVHPIILNSKVVIIVVLIIMPQINQ